MNIKPMLNLNERGNIVTNLKTYEQINKTFGRNRIECISL